MNGPYRAIVETFETFLPAPFEELKSLGVCRPIAKVPQHAISRVFDSKCSLSECLLDVDPACVRWLELCMC